MNTTTVVLAAVVFALVGTMVFAAMAPFIAEQKADATRLMILPPCEDKNDKNNRVCEARPGPGPKPR